MVNIWLVCYLSNLQGPPKVVLSSGTYQLYPIDKTLCSTFDVNRDTVFHLYTRNNTNTSYVLRTGDNQTVTNSPINFTKPTVMFFPDYMEAFKSKDSWRIKNYYLNYSDVNVILVDNERLLAGPYYLTGVLNTKPIANYSAAFLDFLVTRGLNLSTLHMIGIGFGAHIAGYFPCLGLDPAGLTFDILPVSGRLAVGDADFVDILHTNAGGFGTVYSSGDVDIWFNGGITQPGCGPISVLRRSTRSIGELVFCNHYQSWRVYVTALANTTMYLAERCKYRIDYYRTRGKCNTGATTYVGVNVSKSAKGDYYIKTGVTAVDIP
ncbi:hypothetical protein NQ315_008714 [Exocentrus adspersus]|uniref:Lipase domain-containing protein n=1 Tax=Exocentrus adspersus TaxID=1586481 RepID=A0AAV8W5Y4_9CUCU|nr:hypothetical protein NQ315_008714 [Exocentrus adspersus]